ncbi:hypothetical protein [Curtobacterium sp. NPDC089689]|uniref:hypothetical protein n=1 Tax=Curtobacterium sp. NPDC089689 TaxID=3363968 RepID=UPI00380D3C0D
MSSKKHQRVAAIGLGPLVVVASTLLVTPANAATRTAEAADISSPATSVLKEIGRELVISGSGAELASFDRLSSTQRNELASYFLDPAPRGNPNASGGQATSKCKVVVKRGVLTPWGTVAWSTYSAIQRLSARGNGAITANRWE